MLVARKKEFRVGKDEILTTLRNLRETVRRDYCAEIEGIFGSYARGEQRSDSDLDVLVTFREKAHILHLVGLAQFLEEVLQRKVDVVSQRTLRDEIRPGVWKDLVRL
jgi:predicted nucleotidyltransferase